VREFRSRGSVRGAAGNGRPYREQGHSEATTSHIRFVIFFLAADIAILMASLNRRSLAHSADPIAAARQRPFGLSQRP
jgi:hypothetical protein